ncbi:exocyst complex component 4 isoform X3 [Scaptodrosophila lebanonensis]|uniref:Exocyst complex component Sec8 n=1 Tax=Drosophila lebanonensis TaxID=7225 RepID=A0A6J2THI2_DROLE|nr:exocyst complex component 4 isoform X3 [Scaptodrosophila lebanonensis]
MSAEAAQKRASFARRAESLVERKYNISTEKSGDLTVIVQGDLSQQEKRAVFITVHDLGCNHNSFQEFVNSPCMTEIKERSCFIHCIVPGHADNADALPDSFPFPSLQTLGEDLVTVLDYLHVKYVIGLGEGAGANVLARFGLAHPSRALGLILINATGSAASVLQSFKNKFISWKSDEVAQSAESFLMYHKFGHRSVRSSPSLSGNNWYKAFLKFKASSKTNTNRSLNVSISQTQIIGENPDKDKIVAEYQKRLHRSLNSKNVGLYVKAFMNRKDLTLKGCKVDVILITGMLSPYASMVEKLHRDVEKERVTMLKIERAGDVLADAPGKVAQSILLFCKGQGLLTSVVMPGVDRGRAYSTASSGSFEGANGGRRLSRGISMEDYDKPNIRRLSIMTIPQTFSFNRIYMDAPPPTKPPRGVKYGKEDSAGCGFLVNVIKSLGFSETTEERQKEKLKIEHEFKCSDQRLNELVSRHDQQLTQVLPLFSQVSTEVTASRERIHAVKENLGACKRLLQCRRDELKKMWTDAVQHKYLLEMLEQIQELRKVPQRVVSYTAKRQYLHASKALTDALATLNGPLQGVEGLTDLRADLQTRRQQLYQRLHEELVTQVYKNSANEALSTFQRTNSSRLNSSFTRGIGARRSTDRIEANARVRKALTEMAQGFDLDKAEIIEDTDLIDPELSMNYFIAIIVECFGMLHKVPDSLETLRVQIQTELLNVVQNTTHQLSANGAVKDIAGESNPLLMLLEIIFKQLKAIAKTHALLLKNYLAVAQKYTVVGPQPYDLTDFWAQAQSVLQLLLTDYLDIQNTASDENAQSSFAEPTNNINSYFLRRKVPSTKKTMFKFDKSSHTPSNANTQEPYKQHRRNASDASMDDNLVATLGGPAGSGKGSATGLLPHEKKQREKVLICTPDQNVITKVYLPLMGYIQEIENFMKCKPGHPCSLHDFVDNYIKDTFLSKGHNRNLQLTIESLSKNQDAWRTIITPEEMKTFNLSRPLLQSTVMVERRLIETKTLIQDLPCYSEELLKMVCSLLKTYREICQAAYRGIVQPDSEDKRIYSVAWLKDEDISRFLKTLPNWTDLKSSSQRAKHSKKLQRSNFEPSEEESPLQVQQRNIREAEMLTSNLGEGGITQQEILADISVLKELAILQESMEWFSSRVSEFANELRRPLVNGLNAVSAECASNVAIKDGTIKVMTNLALEFDELANTCLLVLHLEVRVQCFHYLRSKSSVKTNSYIGSKDDILEPDRQVQVLTKRLSEMDEAFSATLHPRKTRYIFEGLAHLAARILIQASNYLEHIDQITVQRMCRNSIALQQTLSNITASREVALDQAKHFYELLCMEPDEILNALLERGTEFTEMQYLNALQLSCKVHNVDANSLASYQQKLSDILGAKPSKGVVV